MTLAQDQKAESVYKCGVCYTAQAVLLQTAKLKWQGYMFTVYYARVCILRCASSFAADSKIEMAGVYIYNLLCWGVSESICLHFLFT